MTNPRTQAGAALADDDHQFRLLVENITDYAIYMLDPDGIISNWNAGGQRIKGYRRDEIVGQHFSRFYSEEDRAAGLPQRGLAVAREQGRYEAEGWRYRKDGSRFRASVVIDAIRLDDELIGFAKITRDITDRYEAELRLDEAQRALAQAQKVEAIGKLTFGLAHDFNNLLTVIVNSLDLIRIHRSDEQRTNRLIDGAMRGADRGHLLTKQLLGFARGQVLAPETHDVNALLQRSKDLYRRACDASINLAFQLAPALPPVRVDAAQFEAAMLNLVANGRDALSGSGEMALSTSARCIDVPGQIGMPPRDFVCVCVTDTGTGMTEDTREHAIEPFFTTKEIGKGSGLGLSQVYGFATQSGGFVQIDSTLGEGTTVTICLPALMEAR